MGTYDDEFCVDFLLPSSFLFFCQDKRDADWLLENLPTEVIERFREMTGTRAFLQIDRNRDGEIDKTDFAKLMKGKSKKMVGLLGRKFDLEEDWLLLRKPTHHPYATNNVSRKYGV